MSLHTVLSREAVLFSEGLIHIKRATSNSEALYKARKYTEVLKRFTHINNVLLILICFIRVDYGTIVAGRSEETVNGDALQKIIRSNYNANTYYQVCTSLVNNNDICPIYQYP